MARDPWFSRLIATSCKPDPENLQLAVCLIEMLLRHLEVHKTNEQSGEWNTFPFVLGEATI
jgi:hypothetical protein